VVKIMKNKDSNMNTENLEVIDIRKIPITTNAFTWSCSSILLYLFLHIISLLIPTTMILSFFSFAMDSNFFHWRILLIFIDVLAWWGTYLLTSLALGKLGLIILKLIHKPKEGLFRADKHNRDFSFFCLRVTAKKFIFWIWNNFCFPWVSNFAFRMCDMRAIIGDHVVLGGNSIVAPGTIVGKGTTLGVWTVTYINQILDPDYIYIGKPARKYQPTQKAIEETKKEATRRIIDTGEKIPFDTSKFIKEDKK